jgi:hypothetical protein
VTSAAPERLLRGVRNSLGQIEDVLDAGFDPRTSVTANRSFPLRDLPSTTIHARCVSRAIRSADRSRMKSPATIASAIVAGAVASGRIGAVVAARAGAAAGVRVSVASGSRGGTRMRVVTPASRRGAGMGEAAAVTTAERA